MARDPYKYFRIEAKELVEQLSSGLLELEKGPPSSKLVARILRVAHTLKGAARVVKQVEIAELTHGIEAALSPLREIGSGGAVFDGSAPVLNLLNTIQARLQELAPAFEPGGSAERPSDKPLRTVRAEVTDMDALLESIAEANQQIAALLGNFAITERARHISELLLDQLTAPAARAAPEAPRSQRTISLAEELRDTLSQLDRRLTSAVAHVQREMREVQSRAEHVRLVPVRTLFDSLRRAIRDAAVSQLKQVEFEARGGDSRLDVEVLDGVQHALVQIVRNAVAHGIEASHERAAAKKPPTGRITLDVTRSGSSVLFSCHDDGRGIDFDAVRRAVHKQGNLTVEQIAALDSDALLGLLMKGGITTAGQITEVSGRGIGLDVVQNAIAVLGGQVRIRTLAGVGSTFELRVPLSLSSLEVLLVEAAHTLAAIPLDAVRRTLRVRERDVARSPKGNAIEHDGRIIPFVALSRAFDRAASKPDPVEPWSTVVIEANNGLAALAVDRLLGTADIVLRPLPRLAPANPLIAGVSLDAEGSPRIVLDPVELVKLGQELQSVPRTSLRARHRVLVVDDSLTTRMLEQSILESAGYLADVAVSGEEALEKAQHCPYSLFLVDVEMPGMDGFTFIERAHSDPALSAIPAILVTSRAAPEDRQRGARVGASAYIVKSEFHQGELLKTIRELTA